MGMESKPFGLQSPEFIAKEYGGNKQKIASAAQMGMIDPTSAVLAGMFIDQMRGAQMLEQGPQQTIAQQVLTPQPSAPPMGGPALAPMAAPPMGGPAPAPAPQGPLQLASGGLTTLPVPDNMFDEPAYGGGGIVAFSDGSSGLVKLTDEMLIQIIQDPQAPEEERAAARQELQDRRGPVSDYGAPRTAEDTRAAFAKGLPQGLAEVGKALGSGFMNSEFARDIPPAAAFLERGAVGTAENYSKGYHTLKDAAGEAGGWVLGTDYKSRDQREAEAPPAVSTDKSLQKDQAPQNKSWWTTPLYPFGNGPEQATAAPAAPATSRAPLSAPTEEGLLAAAGPSILNDRMFADILAKNKAAPAQSTAEMFFGKDNATAAPSDAPAPRPQGPAQLAQQAAPSPETAQPAAGAEATSIEDFIAKQRKYQGDAPDAPSKTDLAAQKKEDFWSTLAQMGFNIAGGTSPNALTNIGQGAAATMPAMRDAMKERRAAERENEKLAYEHQLKMWGYRGDEFKAASDLHMKDVDRLHKERQLAEAERHNVASERLQGQQIAASSAASVSDMERYANADRETRARMDEYLKSRIPYGGLTGGTKVAAELANLPKKYEKALSDARFMIMMKQPGGEEALRKVMADMERDRQYLESLAGQYDMPLPSATGGAPSGAIPWDSLK